MTAVQSLVADGDGIDGDAAEALAAGDALAVEGVARTGRGDAVAAGDGMMGRPELGTAEPVADAEAVR